MSNSRTWIPLSLAAVAMALFPASAGAQASGNLQVTARLVDARSQFIALRQVGSRLGSDALAASAEIRATAVSPTIVWRRGAEPVDPWSVPPVRQTAPGEPPAPLSRSTVVVEIHFLDN